MIHVGIAPDKAEDADGLAPIKDDNAVAQFPPEQIKGSYGRSAEEGGDAGCGRNI